jgi:hypothetical protein
MQGLQVQLVVMRDKMCDGGDVFWIAGRKVMMYICP